MKKTNTAERHAIVESAVAEGTKRYIKQCNQRIEPFITKHYSFSGALKIHSHALGLDVVRVPVNIIWSLINIILAILGLAAKAVGLKKISEKIKSIPPGIETDMDKQIKWLVITELLELPFTDGKRTSNKDALMDEILKDTKLKSFIDQELNELRCLHNQPEFKEKIDKKLAEYGATRTGSADLASNIALLISSRWALGQASYGALSAGYTVSALIAQSIAVSNFWLGTTIGSYYYAYVPVVVSLRLIIAITSLVAVVLAIISTFIGIITDPIQAKLGIHKRRLNKLIKSIQEDLEDNNSSEFQLREKYIGRLFDIVDCLSMLRRTIL